MHKCPKCGKMTLQIREEELAKTRPQEIGDCFNYYHVRIQDEWSCMSEHCVNPECRYTR
jgi:hypothetical protein